MAIIALEGMRFYAHHGFYEEERMVGNHYLVDVYIQSPIGRAAAGDDLFATVNYETVYFLCQTEMRRPTQLLETLAQSIGDRLAGQFDQASGVRVRVRKMAPPLAGPVLSAYVEYEAGQFGKSQGQDFGGFADLFHEE